VLQLLGHGCLPWPWRGGESIASIRASSACQLISSQWSPADLGRPSFCRLWGVGLLGFLEAAGQQRRPQLGQHRPQGGEINGLEQRAFIAAEDATRLPTLLSSLRRGAMGVATDMERAFSGPNRATST